MASKPGLEDDIKETDEDIEANMTLSEVCRFVIFSVTYVAIILNQISTESSFNISSGISQAMTACDPSGVATADDVLTWISASLLPYISNHEIYAGWNIESDNGEQDIRLNVMNRIITPLRFVQKRMMTVENDNPRTKSIVGRKWAYDQIEPYIHDSNKEDTRTFKPEHLSIVGGTPDSQKYYMYYYNNSIGINRSGGFMYVFDATNQSAVQEIQDFFDSTQWIDNRTAILYVDFAAYNSHYEKIVYVNYLFTFYSSGIVSGETVIRSSRFDNYTKKDIVRVFFEVVYLLLLGFYTIIELGEIRDDITSEGNKLESDGIDIKYAKALMFANGLKKHFSDLWNILDVTSILLSFIALAYWILISTNKIIRRSTIEYSTDITDDVYEIIGYSITYVQISSVNLLLIFFRLLKYLGKFERVRLLHRTFVRAKTEIFYFFILLIGIFLSFVIFGHVAFGGIHEKFATVGVAFTSCLIILFTNMETVQELLILNFSMTALFIVLFTLFINFILANMFIAIINNSYGTELQRLEEIKNATKGRDEKHWIYQTKDFLIRLKLSIMSCFSKKKAIVNKYADREQAISRFDEEDEVIRAKNYNLDYNDAVIWGEQFDKEVLTDQEKTKKIAVQTKNFSRRVWKALVFIVFAIIYTVVLLNQVEIETKYDLNNTVQTQILNVENSNQMTIENVGTYEDYVGWLEEAFQNLFKLSSAWLLQGNYIAGQRFNQKVDCPSRGSLRLTINYVKVNENPNQLFYDINPIARETDFSPYPGLDQYRVNEDTNVHDYDTTFNCPFKYVPAGSGGFSALGGYVYYFSNIPPYYNNQMSALLNSKLFLNESTNSMIIDFVLYNGDLDYFTYTAFVAQTISGGEIYPTYYIWPLRLKMYFTTGDKVRAFFEVVIVLMLFYHMYVTFSTLRNKFKAYNDWSTRFSEILTSNQKERRRLAKPEWLRKFSSVISSYEILDIVSYCLSLVCMIYWIRYISTDLVLNFTLPTYDTFFHDKFSDQAVILETYMNLSSFNILLIYFRIMNYVTINKSLSCLQDTLKVAMVDIAYFLMMLLVILIGFVFMAYLSFGHTLRHYYTVENSFITCFAMMIGEFNYPELLTADKTMTYIFFFFFMLFFTFILLNIFIAILERAYTKVKNSEGEDSNNVTVFESLIIYFISKVKTLANKVPHTQDHEKDLKNLAVCVFNRIESGLEEDDDPVSWSIKQTEEILMERQKRSEIKAPLDAIFRIRKQNVIEGGTFFFEKKEMDKDIIKEFEARIDYWDYLRIGFLSFQAQEQKIRMKTEELIKKNQTFFDQFKQKELDKEEIMVQIQPIEVALMKIKKENEELRKDIDRFD